MLRFPAVVRFFALAVCAVPVAVAAQSSSQSQPAPGAPCAPQGPAVRRVPTTTEEYERMKAEDAANANLPPCPVAQPARNTPPPVALHPEAIPHPGSTAGLPFGDERASVSDNQHLSSYIVKDGQRLAVGVRRPGDPLNAGPWAMEMILVVPGRGAFKVYPILKGYRYESDGKYHAIVQVQDSSTSIPRDLEGQLNNRFYSVGIDGSIVPDAKANPQGSAEINKTLVTAQRIVAGR